MVILFREFLDNPGMDKFVKKDATLNLLYKEIRKFVIDRLMPLKDEINSEEANFKDYSPCIIFSFIEHEKFGIMILHDYSKELSLKMESCFKQSDLDFLFSKINTLRKAMDN